MLTLSSTLLGWNFRQQGCLKDTHWKWRSKCELPGSTLSELISLGAAIALHRQRLVSISAGLAFWSSFLALSI